MFNDRFGLTASVIDKTKTMTRRIFKPEFEGYKTVIDNDFAYIHVYQHLSINHNTFRTHFPKYKIDEVVAVAQSYREISLDAKYTGKQISSDLITSSGWRNKMFVKAELMPHHLKITNIRIERLQDISDEDCISEGIIEHTYSGYMVNGIAYKTKDDFNGSLKIFGSPKEAYAALIDKISGKGTWDSNPYCFVYEFELID